MSKKTLKDWGMKIERKKRKKIPPPKLGPKTKKKLEIEAAFEKEIEKKHMGFQLWYHEYCEIREKKYFPMRYDDFAEHRYNGKTSEELENFFEEE